MSDEQQLLLEKAKRSLIVTEVQAIPMDYNRL
jgi:hypothetical protein